MLYILFIAKQASRSFRIQIYFLSSEDMSAVQKTINEEVSAV